MAIAFTNLGSNANPDYGTGTDATSYSNSAWTPPTSGIIICAIVWRQTGFENEKPLMTGNGLKWNFMSYEDGGSGTIATAFFAAFASGSSNGANTWDFRGRTATYFNASFFQITGAYEGGTIYDAFVQIKTASGSGTSGSMSMVSAASLNDRCFSIWGKRTNENITPKTNWTELDDAASFGSADGLATHYRSDAFEGALSASWSTSEAWEGIGVEVRESSIVSVSNNYSMPHWRIRTGDTVGLNTDSGWAAAEDTVASIPMGDKFRVRIKVDRDTTGSQAQFKLQALHVHDGGIGTGWWDASVLANSEPDGCVIGLQSDQYVDQAATSSELLTSDGSLAYENGEGIETNPTNGNVWTKLYDLDNEETEFEWTLQITQFYAQPYINKVDAGDKIYLRVVKTDGSAFPSVYSPVEITVSANNGYVGGTFAEKPGEVMWADGSDLYYYCEVSEWEAENVMLKSTDDGDTWDFIDRNGRPSNNDMESADGKLVSSVIHIVEQMNNDPWYHTFNTSTDQWVIDEEIKTATRDDQVAAIAVRSDGTEIGFWEELVGGYRRIVYRIRSSGGTWGSDNNLDSEASRDFTDVAVVVGDSDLTHIFYVDNTDGHLFHNTINSSDTLGTREEVGSNVAGTAAGEENPITGVVRYDSSGTDRVVVVYKNDSNNYLHAAKVDDNGSPSTPIAVTGRAVYNDPQNSGNDMPVSGVAVDGTDIYVAFADSVNGEIWVTKSADFAAFDTDTKIISNVEAFWLRTVVYTPTGGGTNLGIIYENDSHGGHGQGWFYNYVIDSGSATLTVDDLSQANSVSVPALVQEVTLTVDNLSQTNSVTVPAITVQYTLSPINIYQLNSIEIVSLSLGDLTVYDLSQANFIETVVISTGIVADIDFEENDLSDWPATQDPASRLSTSSGAAMAGSSYGMEVVFDEFNPAYGRVTDETPLVQSGEMRYRFYFDPNSIALASGNAFAVNFIPADGTHNSVYALFHLRVQENGASYNIMATAKDDSDTDRNLTTTSLTNLDHYLEVLLTRESSDGAADGICRVYIDDGEIGGGITNLENFNIWPTMTEIRFGACFGLDALDSGSIFIDEIIIRDDTQQISAVDALPVVHLGQENTVSVPTLTQVHNLQVSDLSHTNTVTTVLVGIGLNPRALSQANTVDLVPITITYILDVHDLSQGNVVTTMALAQFNNLSVDDLSQSNQVDRVAIEAEDLLPTNDLSMANVASVPSLTQIHNLSVHDLAQFNRVTPAYIGTWWFETLEGVGLVTIEHDVVGLIEQVHEEYGVIDMEEDQNAYIDQQEDGDGEIGQVLDVEADIALTHEGDGEL